MKKQSETTGPLFARDGSIAVDAARCPTLHRALTRMKERGRPDDGWSRVVELRRGGDQDAADRLVRRLLGVQGPPMSEETKAKLRAYNEEHREEIRERRRLERETRERTLALLRTGRKGRK